MRQIFLDTETTGLSPDNGDRIIEIGCVELLHRKLTGNNLHLYINPERDSHEDALRVHGITTEFLKDKPKFAEVVDQFLDYIEGAEVIIHNAPFDIGFLNKELERVGKKPLKAYVSGVIDTLAMAKEMFPGKRNSLDALCERLEIDNTHRNLHGALLDAELLAEVYLVMTRGQDGFAMVFEESAESIAFSADAGRLRDLRIQTATELEHQEHLKVLEQIQKESGGKCLWLSQDAALAAQ